MTEHAEWIGSDGEAAHSYGTSPSVVRLRGVSAPPIAPLSRCHPALIADVLCVRGIEVVDIIVVMIKSAPNDIRVLLFDVGGVLVQLSGVEAMLEWLGHGISVDELWRRWLQSVPVRRFETGQIDADEFAIGVTSEFGLPVEPRQFLESFTHWPTGLYPGTLEMLARIPRSYQRAVLSNSNALHWPRVQNEMKLGAAFDTHFVSHLTGRIKPDAAAFEHVVESLGCSPASVLFLDDNLLNVDAAKRLGMQAVRVQGIDETQRVLVELKIMPV